MRLINHRPRRRTGRSPEPGRHRPRRRRAAIQGPRFVIQLHEKDADHYDFRLEIDGVLVSWAIPRAPVVNSQDWRMARRTEDHALGEVGIEAVDEAVTVWDCGTYANKTEHEITTCLHRGHLLVLLHGDKLHGGYALTRVREGEDEAWLLVRRRDTAADAMSRVKR